MSGDHEVQLSAVDLTVEAGRRALVASFCVPPLHPVLAGHFPTAPLVPGVLLLDGVRRACELAFAAPLAIRAVLDVRFLQPVQPGEVLTLSVAVSGEAPHLEVEGVWLGAGGRVAAFRLHMGPRIA